MQSYDEFRHDYERQHPASIPIKPSQTSGEYPLWLRFVVLLMFLSSALISGVHTVPTVYEGIESSIAPLIRALAALGSFIAIEVSFFVSPFAQLGNDKRMARIGLAVSFTIALTANINSVSKAMLNGSISPLVIGVALTFGVGMPLLAFISGALFVNMTAARSKGTSEALKLYREESKLYDATILTAFRKHCKEQELVSAPVRPILSEQTDSRQTLPSPSGFQRTADGQQRVIDFLNSHSDPKVRALSVRNLAKAITDETGIHIGHDTAARGKNAWSEQQQIHIVRSDKAVNDE